MTRDGESFVVRHCEIVYIERQCHDRAKGDHDNRPDPGLVNPLHHTVGLNT